MSDETTGVLVLVRHGESYGNAADMFTGRLDVDLTDLGRDEARAAGTAMARAGITVDVAFTSIMRRASETCSLIMQSAGCRAAVAISDPALNERDYGALTGLTKAQAFDRWGRGHVEEWRRSYAIAPPEGESLKDTGARVWLFYLREILPVLLEGRSAMVTAHGNSLRALMMAIEGISAECVIDLEVPRCAPIAYKVDRYARLTSRMALNLGPLHD
jgi:2,3-bisphosphoglycerate-dependent phosphoglycerate mutase